MIKSKMYSVELWDEPTKKFRDKSDYVCEVSEQNPAFISGIIRMKRPKKIVELGVAKVFIRRCCN